MSVCFVRCALIWRKAHTSDDLMKSAYILQLMQCDRLFFYLWTSFERAHTFSHMQIQQQKTNHCCFQTRGLQIALKSEWCALDEPTMATQAMTQSQQNDAYRTMMDWWHGASCAQSYHLYMATLKVVALNIKQKRNDKPNFNSTHDHRSMSSPRMFTTHSVEVRWGEVFVCDAGNNGTNDPIDTTMWPPGNGISVDNPNPRIFISCWIGRWLDTAARYWLVTLATDDKWTLMWVQRWRRSEQLQPRFWCHVSCLATIRTMAASPDFPQCWRIVCDCRGDKTGAEREKKSQHTAMTRVYYVRVAAKENKLGIFCVHKSSAHFSFLIQVIVSFEHAYLLIHTNDFCREHRMSCYLFEWAQKWRNSWDDTSIHPRAGVFLLNAHIFRQM